MQMDKSISIGNVISWIMIIASIAFGWAKLESATAQNTKDAYAAMALAEKVEKAQRDMDYARAEQIQTLTVDMATTKVIVATMDKKLDEIISNQRRTQNKE
jgi:Flp pilus assembly protein TadG